MGSCCSYVLKFDRDPPVADPITVNEIQQVCDKSSTKITDKKESLPHNNGLILTLNNKNDKTPKNNKSSKTNKNDANLKNDKNDKTPPLSSNNPKERYLISPNKPQTLMVEPMETLYLHGNGSKTLQLLDNIVNSLNPGDILRKDNRALTSREEEKAMLEKNLLKNQQINIQELKIDEEIIKRINKLNEIKGLKGNKEDCSPLRSQTLGNEDNLFDDLNEGTHTKREDIKKSLIDSQNPIQILEKKPSKILHHEDENSREIKEKSKSIDKKSIEQHKENVVKEKEAQLPLPRKSLLKRYKTIGDDSKKEKSKKKVKFKDLFDAKGKKKVRKKK